MLDWRSLLSAADIEWKDRGPNCSRGNVNICCPWCLEERFHLTISETDSVYFCYRDSSHKGIGAHNILRAYRISHVKATQLEADYTIGSNPELERLMEERQLHKRSEVKKWNSFAPASENDEGMAYLLKRGFDFPEKVADRYNLRYATKGEHRNRVLFPLSTTDAVVGWTGRALRANMVPRYWSICEEPHTCFAGEIADNVPTLILVEGPVDALKVNYCLPGIATSVALCGKSLSPDRMALLQHMEYRNILVTLDYGVSVRASISIINELRQTCRNSQIRRAALPSTVKDPGEFTVETATTWFRKALAES